MRAEPYLYEARPGVLAGPCLSFSGRMLLFLSKPLGVEGVVGAVGFDLVKA